MTGDQKVRHKERIIKERTLKCLEKYTAEQGINKSLAKPDEGKQGVSEKITSIASAKMQTKVAQVKRGKGKQKKQKGDRLCCNVPKDTDCEKMIR